MRRISFERSIGAAGLALLLVAGTAFASPSPNSAVLHLRVFDDCFSSTLNTSNLYAASIMMNDNLNCTTGFANLHNWHFSENGTTDAVFNNGDSFRVGLDLVINGPGGAESGIQIAPWWSQNVDGRFNVRIPDGEIACFGGRLPFYSFTGTYGLRYAAGTLIHLEACYTPNGLSEQSPATIEYKVEYGGQSYSSGPKPFDSGFNPTDPPHGLYGIMDDARVGGHYQCFIAAAGATSSTATWSNITYGACSTVGVEQTTWGTVKGLYRH